MALGELVRKIGLPTVAVAIDATYPGAGTALHRALGAVVGRTPLYRAKGLFQLIIGQKRYGATYTLSREAHRNRVCEN